MQIFFSFVRFFSLSIQAETVWGYAGCDKQPNKDRISISIKTVPPTLWCIIQSQQADGGNNMKERLLNGR